MRLHDAQRQTQNLRKFSSVSRSSSNSIIRKNLTPMRASGVLLFGLAATAGISSLAFALQHDNKPAHQTITPTIHSTPATLPEAQTSETSVTIDSATTQQDTNGSAPAETTVSGQATINNEVIPLSEGTVERSFTDNSGTEHTVTISLDGETTVFESNSSNTDIHITSSSSSSGTNTTRGSPRR